MCTNEIPVQGFPFMKVSTVTGKPTFETIRISQGLVQTFDCDKVIFNPNAYSREEIFNYGSMQHYYPMAIQIVIS